MFIVTSRSGHGLVTQVFAISDSRKGSTGSLFCGGYQQVECNHTIDRRKPVHPVGSVTWRGWARTFASDQLPEYPDDQRSSRSLFRKTRARPPAPECLRPQGTRDKPALFSSEYRLHVP